MTLLMVAAPVLLAVLVVGLVVSIFQATTQINEATLAFVPKLVAAVLVLAIAGPWMLSTLVDYLRRTLQSIPRCRRLSADVARDQLHRSPVPGAGSRRCCGPSCARWRCSRSLPLLGTRTVPVRVRVGAGGAGRAGGAGLAAGDAAWCRSTRRRRCMLVLQQLLIGLGAGLRGAAGVCRGRVRRRARGPADGPELRRLLRPGHRQPDHRHAAASSAPWWAGCSSSSTATCW